MRNDVLNLSTMNNFADPDSLNMCDDAVAENSMNQFDDDVVHHLSNDRSSMLTGC